MKSSEQRAPLVVVTFLGPPGSGKGTISQLCVKELGWTQISTGNLCRKHVADGTEVGKEIDFAIKSGKLIPDSLISTMVWDWFRTMMDSARGVILDGFPRTAQQAKNLVTSLQHMECPGMLRVIRFTVSTDIVTERLATRMVCSNKDCQLVYSTIANSLQSPQIINRCDVCASPLQQRIDDASMAIVRERLKTYASHEQELLAFYKSAAVQVCDLAVDAEVSSIFENFKKLVRIEF